MQTKNRTFIIFLLCVTQSPKIYSLEQVHQTIHVFGDSHARFGYGRHCNIANHVVRYNDQIQVPFVVHELQSVTMHRIGRDKLKILNLVGLREHDIAVFTFGEIDVRCHIAKQRDMHGRDLEEILDTLVTNYFETILLNRAQFKDLHCVVAAITAPTDAGPNPVLPNYGPLDERIAITQALNQKLKIACIKNNMLFLATNDIYATDEGILHPKLSDNTGGVHIGQQHNLPLQAKLIALLIAAGSL